MNSFNYGRKEQDINDRTVETIKEEKRKLYIYGTGGGARRAFECFEKNGLEVIAFADRPQFFSEGDKLLGKPIIDIKTLLESEEEILHFALILSETTIMR